MLNLRMLNKLLLIFTLFFALTSNAQLLDTEQTSDIIADRFYSLIYVESEDSLEKAFKTITLNWEENHTPFLLQLIDLGRSPIFAEMAIDVLQEVTEQDFGFDLDKWYEWWWNYRDDNYIAENSSYSEFLFLLYREIDPRFAEYFRNYPNKSIDLDEIRWGGVMQNGIPPLRYVKKERAKKANKWLKDHHIVFGVNINDEAIAYPKRILGWHEMFIDNIGGEEVTGVYCTLCGMVRVYESSEHALGTSGLLYRSNKLMFDEATSSLWNSFTAEPVVGDLMGRNIKLKTYPIRITTWGDWKERHPDSDVLSLDTGHRRNYGEGEAYKKYYSNDKLMFTTPLKNKYFNNKAETLGAFVNSEPIAIIVELLNKKSDYKFKYMGEVIKVFYDTGWRVTINDEEIETTNSFWFGWLNQFPETATYPAYKKN